MTLEQGINMTLEEVLEELDDKFVAKIAELSEMVDEGKLNSNGSQKVFDEIMSQHEYNKELARRAFAEAEKRDEG